MSRDGSGNYTLPEAAFTAGTTIESSKVNSNFSDIQAALTASIAKDGQTVPTANLPMGSFKHTGVANATARTHYAAAGQIADNSMGYAADTGSADACAIAPAPGISAYAVGQRFTFKVAASNLTTTPTLAVNGLTAGLIKLPDGSALVAGDLPANALVEVVVAATTPVFHLQTVSFSTGTGANVRAVSPALTGNPTAPTQTAGDNSTKIATTAYVDGGVLRSKVITFTRAPGASSGSVSYTGVGFKPTSVWFFGSQGGGTRNAGIAFSDSAKTIGNIYDSLNWDMSTSFTIGVGAGNQAASISSYDSDGFTLSWTKTGAPGGSDFSIYALCLR